MEIYVKCTLAQKWLSFFGILLVLDQLQWRKVTSSLGNVEQRTEMLEPLTPSFIVVTAVQTAPCTQTHTHTCQHCTLKQTDKHKHTYTTILCCVVLCALRCRKCVFFGNAVTSCKLYCICTAGELFTSEGAVCKISTEFPPCLLLSPLMHWYKVDKIRYNYEIRDNILS